MTSAELDSYAACLKNLTDMLDGAYWSASDIHSKDTLYNLERIVRSAYDEAVSTQITNDNAKLVALKSSFQAANTSLTNVKNQIEQLTKNVQVATQVAAAIDKVVSMAGSLGLI